MLMTSRWLHKARAYLRVVQTQLKSLSHFRANVVAWLLYSPLQLAILFLLWKIVYSNTDRVGSFAFDDMMLYYLVVHFLRKMIEPVQSTNFLMWQEINQGKLDIYLARPVSFGLYTFFRSLGTPILELVLGIPFFVVFALLLGLPLQRDPGVLLLFVASIASGYLILFLIQFLIGSLTFWMERIFGIRDMIFSVFILFSGQLIPISVLPGWVGTVSRYLPFEGIYYVPATIYTQSGLDEQALVFLGQQAVWVTVLLVLSMALWSRGIVRYVSQGG